MTGNDRALSRQLLFALPRKVEGEIIIVAVVRSCRVESVLNVYCRAMMVDVVDILRLLLDIVYFNFITFCCHI